MDKQHHQHRSGSLKQQNKTFKAGKHDSKGAIKRRTQGKVENQPRQSLKSMANLSNRMEIRNQKQAKLSNSKKTELLERRRLGLPDLVVPRIVTIIGLGDKCNTKLVKDNLLQKFNLSSAADSMNDDTTTTTTTTTNNNNNSTTVFLSGKVRMTLFECSSREPEVVIEYAKLSDILLFVMDAGENEKLNDEILHTFSIIKAQGVPTVMLLLQNLDKVPQKKRNDIKKTHQSNFYFHFPDEPKVLPSDSEDDFNQILRFVENVHINDILWRRSRPYILIEKSTNQENILTVEGFIRGNNLSADQIINIPDLGDFQIQKIESIPDPHVRVHNTVRNNPYKSMDTDSDKTKVLQESTEESRETLQTYNIPNELENEIQPIPTEDEINAALNKKKKLVPKGTSAYQASWYLDDTDEEDEYDEDDDDEMMEGEEKDMQDEEEAESEEEELEEAKDETSMEFPDEVDPPENIPCRVRYSKYRGLKSFRTSPWDSKENLPLDYAKIYQFHSFNQSMKKSIALSDKAPAKGGMYVRVHLLNPKNKSIAVATSTTTPIVAIGLYKYENKISVLHFNVEKHRSYENTIKSKEEVVFHIGFRKFSTRPIYSLSSANCDKQKYEKFLFPGRNSVASIYGPITYPPAPLLIFKEKDCSQLIATGYLASVNPDRIICKRIIFTGYIAKSISKKFVTVRDMFYFTEDINWFKKIELHTKLGRVGHIKDSLGTHGRMKCLFDGTMNQQDTICMNLYKRVYPKWINDDNLILGDQQVLPENNNNEQMTTKVKSKSTLSSFDGEEVIDLPGNKLLEWLTSRNKIPQNWKKEQQNILKQIAIALKQAPSQTLKKEDPQDIHFFECLKVFKEFESEPNGSSKTLFGGYSNNNTQKWYDVIKAYEKNHYNIGESCQLFSQNLNYEIPNLKKIVEKSIKTLEDNSKKETEYTKSKTSAINSFKKACTDLGIQGDKIREEIVELPKLLNSLFEQTVKLLSNDELLDILKFYKEFNQFSLSNLPDDKREEITSNLLPITSFLIKHGNVTLGEREKILNPNSNIKLAGDDKQQQDNNNNSNSDNKLEIDWCMDIPTANEGSTSANVVVDDTPITIEWEDDMKSPPSIQWDDFSMDSIELVDETPLEMFLSFRIQELSKSSNMEQIASETSVDSNKCKLYLKLVTEIIQSVSNNKIKQIIEIKSSKKYV
eukprot:gene9615-11782_t